MNTKDLLAPGAIALGVVAAGALGFALGYAVARDPQKLRQLARAIAGGVERVSGAIAESREELADLWAEVRADAQADIEAQHFAAEESAAAAAPHAAAAEHVSTAPAARRHRAARPPAPRRSP